MKLLYFIFYTLSFSIATQWQIPQPCQPVGIAFTGPSFTSVSNRIYCSIYYPTYGSDIAYYDWDGTQWLYIDRVQGDVNTDHDEEEPFISYDSQQLYYTRSVNQ